MSRISDSQNQSYAVIFPHSCVLYLRHTTQTPDALTVKINLPDGQHFLYHTPTVKLQEYTREEIFQKRLLFFLPFYIMRYEKELSKIAQDPVRVSRLLAEYEEIRVQLKRELPTDEEAAILPRLAELTERISDYILKSEQLLKERIGDVMGGKVLELETDKILAQAHERGLSQGREEGLEQGLEQGIEQGLEQGIERERFSVIKRMLRNGLSTEEIILYTGYTREDILPVKKRL